MHRYICIHTYNIIIVNYDTLHVFQLDSLSTEAAVTITLVIITFILTLIIATVITFIVTYRKVRINGI